MNMQPAHKEMISEGLQRSGLPIQATAHFLELVAAILAKGNDAKPTIVSLLDLVKGAPGKKS